MKILNIDPYCYSIKAANLYQSLGLYREANPSNKNELINLLKDVDVLVMRLSHNIDRDVIYSSKTLKVIATNATGIDHIDEDAAKERKVKIISLRGEHDYLNNITASAEHTWALLLSLVRKIPQAVSSVKNGEWSRQSFMGMQLNGKKLGIIGCGRNGSKIAVYGEAFGMKVYINDRYRTNLPGRYIAETIDYIFKNCDVVSINIPYTKNNIGIIDRKLIESMKTDAILLNTSRGQILDEEALMDSINNSKIGGAALDVVCNENNFKEHKSKMIECAKINNKLLITPHIGGVTKESWEETEIFIAKKTLEYLN